MSNKINSKINSIESNLIQDLSNQESEKILCGGFMSGIHRAIGQIMRMGSPGPTYHQRIGSGSNNSGRGRTYPPGTLVINPWM